VFVLLFPFREQPYGAKDFLLPFHKSPPWRFYQQSSRQFKGGIDSILTAKNASACAEGFGATGRTPGIFRRDGIALSMP
jgi:hypothetical protein